MALAMNEQSSYTDLPKKPQKVAAPKQIIALFLHNSTMTVAPPKVMTFFYSFLGPKNLKHEKAAPYFSYTSLPFFKAITDYRFFLLELKLFRKSLSLNSI